MDPCNHRLFIEKEKTWIMTSWVLEFEKEKSKFVPLVSSVPMVPVAGSRKHTQLLLGRLSTFDLSWGGDLFFF